MYIAFYEHILKNLIIKPPVHGKGKTKEKGYQDAGGRCRSRHGSN